MESTQQPENFRNPARWNTVPVPERVALRAIENVEKREDGCWISLYSVASHGYAQIGWHDAGLGKTNMVLAHRAAWVATHGQLPIGVTIDHTCKVRPCVNPAHLRLMSNSDNARRNQGDDFPLGQCRHGHPEENFVPVTRRSKAGERRQGLTCGVCAKDSRDRWAAANPEQKAASQKRYADKKRSEQG